MVTLSSVLFSSWGHVGACGVCALPVDQSPHSGSSLCPTGLVEESIHPQDLHLSGSPRLPSGHAGGLQRSVDKGRYLQMSRFWSGTEIPLCVCNDLSCSLDPVSSPLFSGDFRGHSGPGLGSLALAPSNSGEGCNAKLPVCPACWRCGSLCSVESAVSGGLTCRSVAFSTFSFSRSRNLLENLWLLELKWPYLSCLYRGEILDLLELDLRWEEATIHHGEVPLSGQWWKWGNCPHCHYHQLNPTGVYLKWLVSLPLAQLTVLLLCERLFLDHAHRLNTSKSQWVWLFVYPCRVLSLHELLSTLIQQFVLQQLGREQLCSLITFVLISCLP